MRWAVLALLVCSAFGQKKQNPEPPQIWPTSRVMHCSCDLAWPTALQTAIAEGWTVKTSDRAGGLLTLDWTKGYQYGNSRAINPLVNRHTTAKTSGFSHQFTRFQIVSASVISTPEATGCRLSMAVVYHGTEVSYP